ncbi:MAG: class I SAM-dependent methyltransferase [bacterium]|nr:class I SAM-dependent methyltransferase [bacterium]
MESSKSALDRYHHKPFIGSSHTWALNIAATRQPKTPILDIGCGSSPIGIALKERGFTDLTAIEVDKDAMEKAKQVYSQVTANIEELQGRKFGFIFLLDVLEHLSDPESYLGEVLKLLENGGYLAISVPNVAHWSVRLPLLFGFFNYTDRAILDRTHLHFFTRRTFKKILLTHKELELCQINASIEPAEFVLPKLVWDNKFFKALSLSRVALANMIPGLMAYQHLALLRKR